MICTSLGLRSGLFTTAQNRDRAVAYTTARGAAGGAIPSALNVFQFLRTISTIRHFVVAARTAGAQMGETRWVKPDG